MKFEHLSDYAGDPILSLMDKFHADPRQHKFNLSVGFYYDEEGQVPVLESVKLAKHRLDTQPQLANTYLPMEGKPDYRRSVQKHLFGSDSNHNKIVTIQSLGGSGALRIAADFVQQAYPGSHVWISNPSWDNHHAIFQQAGFEVRYYPYLNESKNGIDFSALKLGLQQAKENDVVILHACCHNPTGFDLTPSQWDEIFDLCVSRKLIPLLDAAYIGMGDGFDQDIIPIRKLVLRNITGLVTNSFSKVFSLYGERIGSLSVVVGNPSIADKVLGQLKATVRANYSSPPRLGAALVNEILNDPELYTMWHKEVEAMRVRMLKMRNKLHTELQVHSPNRKHDYLIKQKGMFSYTGLSPEQVILLREEFGVYLIGNGRLCISGLNDSNLDTIARRIATVL